jgi:hypothetical protein
MNLGGGPAEDRGELPVIVRPGAARWWRCGLADVGLGAHTVLPVDFGWMRATARPC